MAASKKQQMEKKEKAAPMLQIVSADRQTLAAEKQARFEQHVHHAAAEKLRSKRQELPRVQPIQMPSYTHLPPISKTAKDTLAAKDANTGGYSHTYGKVQDCKKIDLSSAPPVITVHLPSAKPASTPLPLNSETAKDTLATEYHFIYSEEMSKYYSEVYREPLPKIDSPQKTQDISCAPAVIKVHQPSATPASTPLPPNSKTAKDTLAEKNVIMGGYSFN